ncbi:hypothetical protein FRB94_008971 [Tulasnella sp. JGI-2019a]|nr:hypothetical protein FRB93_003498 [Tulasnella sp. JGI-2019a]KAG9014813.1 hypothetical protein FRB94_008971 [Tulasnella sp. JGI-2019a]KAG9040025.1 hypothetical protein FRB95_004497 [Tulasnella sp. JGI-2019a]
MSNQEVLQEEFEVLESIYPDELEKISDSAIQITVAPDTQVPEDQLRTTLHVEYPPEYPDVTPLLSLTIDEGNLSQEEESTILANLKTTAEESLGMAQTFTIVSTLVDALGAMVEDRVKKKQMAKEKKEQEEVEAELKRLQGTPVTPASFLAWRDEFKKRKQVQKRARDEEKMRDMTGKDREEFKKIQSRLSGRQLFERNKDLATSDAALVEEGVEAVDITKFERNHEDASAAEDEGLHFSDSD